MTQIISNAVNIYTPMEFVVPENLVSEYHILLNANNILYTCRNTGEGWQFDVNKRHICRATYYFIRLFNTQIQD